MTGLKFEYTWPTAVFYFQSLKGIYMDTYIFTFLVVVYEVNCSDGIHMEWEQLHNSVIFF